ncbi:hypothetical protein [Sphingopyxis sp. 550A]
MLGIPYLLRRPKYHQFWTTQKGADHYFKTVGRSPIPLPATSLAAQPDLLERSRGQVAHDGDVWFAEPCEEIALASDQYDFTISLLHLEPVIRLSRFDEAEEDEDAFDVMSRRLTGRR